MNKAATERLAAQIAEYEPTDVVDWLDDKATFLLVEQSNKTEEYYFTLHQTPQEASEYSVDQDCAEDWEPVKLVDLVGGQTWEPEVICTVRWNPPRKG